MLTQAEAARIKGVSRSAITRAVREGRVVLNKDGLIDERRKVNKLYLSTEKYTPMTSVKAGDKSGTKTGGKDAPGSGSTQVLTPTMLNRLASRQEKADRAKEAKSALEAQKTREEIEKLRIYNGEKRRTLVPVLTAAHTMADLGATISTHLLQFPRRVCERVRAMSLAGATTKDVELYLAGEMTRAIEQFQATAIERFEAAIAEIDEAEDDDDADEEEE